VYLLSYADNPYCYLQNTFNIQFLSCTVIPVRGPHFVVRAPGFFHILMPGKLYKISEKIL